MPIPDDGSPVDLAAFRAVMREAGAEEAVESTLAIYLKEVPPLYEQLEAAIEARDARRAASLAHAVKSPSASIRAAPLVSVLDALEAAARSGDAEGAAAHFEELRPRFAAALHQLRALRP